MRGLPRQAKGALEKALDSALLGVEVYNKPAVKFKSGGYITLMVIAWTALLHAIFFKRKVKPFYKKANGHFEKIEGDFKYWELDECLSQYFQTDTGNPIRKNLEFFIPLRNRIEHRSMPELDASIFGECQAMLLNFDEMVEKEFSARLCLRESLSFALQLFPSSASLAAAIQQNPTTKPVVDFVQQYRSTISAEVAGSGKFAFKAFLIQVGNHESESALPIQFVHYDKLPDEQKKQLSSFAVMVKNREVPVANPDTIRPVDVTKKVQASLGNPQTERSGKLVNRFNLTTHTRCWKRYKARPEGGSGNPEATDWKFCIYDKRHNDYGYTQAWVKFLIEKLKDATEFDAVCKSEIVAGSAKNNIKNHLGRNTGEQE